MDFKKKNKNTKTPRKKKREKFLNAFKSGKFPLPTIKGTGYPSDLASCLKILSPKQTDQTLPIAFAQVKAGSMSKNLLTEIWQIIYFLHPAKEIIKKVYNNIMDSIKL